MQAEAFDKQFDRGEDISRALDLSKAKRPNDLHQSSDSTQPRTPELLTGQLGDAFFEPLPEEELQQWE